VETLQFDNGDALHDAQVDSPTSMLVPIVRSRWIVAICVVLGAVAGVAFGVIQANSYTSVGKLLVRYGAREEASPENVISGGGAQGFNQPRGLVNNEIELLSVPLVFERVAREITPPRIFSSYDPSAEDGPESSRPVVLFHKFQAWWFRRASSEQSTKVGHPLDNCDTCVAEATHELTLDLHLNAEPDSNVITVSYTTHDPELARLVVTTFLAKAEQRHRESYNANSTLDFVSERVKTSLAEVKAAEDEFSAYRVACDVYNLESQRTSFLTELRALETKEGEDAITLAKLHSHEKVLVDLLNEIPATTPQEIDRPPVANPQWTALQTRLWTQKDALAAIDTRVGGTTADRESARAALAAQIELTKKEMEGVEALIPQPPTIQNVPNPRHQRLTQELDTLRQDIAGHESTAAESSKRLANVRDRIIATEQCEPKYHSLEATAKNARDRYETFNKAHERTSNMMLLDSLEFSNLRRIQDATLPFEKDGPKRAKFVIIGLLAGALVGAGLAFARHAVDPFVRSPADVESLLGLKLVGVTPRSRLPWRMRRAIRRALRTAAL
jgi:uncharacterized protein involved in exopolysaccharide biosynthesis